MMHPKHLFSVGLENIHGRHGVTRENEYSKFYPPFTNRATA